MLVSFGLPHVDAAFVFNGAMRNDRVNVTMRPQKYSSCVCFRRSHR
jgi:hypothetical protein